MANKKITSPSYLQSTPYGYYFRIKLPHDVRHIIGRTELKCSLRTCKLSEAKERSRILASLTQMAISNIRSGGRMSELSDTEIQSILRRYFHGSLQGDKDWRTNRKPVDDEELDEQAYMWDEFQTNFREDLAKSNYHNVSNYVTALVKDLNLDVKGDSETYKKLCRGMLKVQIDLLGVYQRRQYGDYEYEKRFIQAPIAATPDTTHSDRISEVVKHYVSEAETNWTPKTKSEIVDDSLALLIQVFGDIPIQTVDRKRMNEFKQVLRKLPPNRSKLKKYRDKSIDQLVRMNVDKTLSERTINKHLTRIGTLFDYAINNGFYNGHNPAIKIGLPMDKDAQGVNAAYTLDELKRLFHSEKYLTDTHLQPCQFWTPVIALFTGMRQNEIAQLYLDDIREVDGVWYFDLNTDKPDKKLKNKNARRKVPIHKFIVEDLKLPEYVNHLRAKGPVRLFPEISPDRDGYGGPVSKWFNERYKTKCGFKMGDRLKSFHSFRSTFISALEDKVQFRKLQQCAGHSRGKSDTVTYIETYNPKQLYDDAVSKLEYPIDLSHLKNSKFVP